MTSDTRDIAVFGGLYIAPTTGLTTLSDMYGDADDQTIVDQADPTVQATLFIPLYPSETKAFRLEQIRICYADTANADDLANVWLFNESSATDITQYRAIVWSVGGVAEIPIANIDDTDWTDVDTATRKAPPIYLDEKGKLYFMTNWTTAVISCGAATEYFLIEVKGTQLKFPETPSWRN